MEQQLYSSGLTPIEPAEQSNTTSTWFWPLVIAMSSFILIFAGFIIWTISSKKPAASYPLAVVTPTSTGIVSGLAPLSGQVFIDGYASTGAMLTVSTKEIGKETMFHDIGLPVKAIPVTAWIRKDAVQGANYEVYAALSLNGKIIQQSVPITISSPATNANIRLVSNQQPTLPQQAAISGTIDLRGYVSSGSSVTILAKSIAAAAYGPVATASPVTNAPWTWNGAVSGTSYDIKAQIQGPDGAINSNQVPIVITAPSTSQTLIAQSVATPNSPTIGSIAGSVILNGVVPPNSHITLSTRKSGSGTFTQVLSNITASSNVSFVWGLATVGTSYDVQATLWSNNKQIATSQVATITAPAAFEVLTINAQIPIAAASITSFNPICATRQSDLAPVTLSYNMQNNLSSPVQYNVVITDTNGKQVLNSVVSPVNPSQPQTTTTNPILIPGNTYFAQYSYAQCTNCGTFTPLSNPIQLICQ